MAVESAGSGCGVSCEWLWSQLGVNCESAMSFWDSAVSGTQL